MESVTDDVRVRVLFDEFCLWRERVIIGNYQHSFCDEQSNRLLKRIRELGYSIVYSDDPASDNYYYGLTTNMGDNVSRNEIIITACELGYDLSKDPKRERKWNRAERK